MQIQKQNNKNEIIKLLIIIGILLVFIVLGFCYYYSNNNSNILKSNNKRLKDLPAISYYYENESGDYILGSSNTFTIAGYEINKSLSGCENGGTLSIKNNKVKVETVRSDKCYLYFDIKPDLITNINYSGNKANLRFANATKNVNCLGATWDNKLGGFTTSLTGKSPTVECSINATNNSTTTYLNNYIMSLDGTTQGNGQLVHENNALELNKTPMSYTLSSGTAMTEGNSNSDTYLADLYTYEGGETTARTSSYHKFTPTENGYYYLCYSIPSSAYTSNNNNYKNYLTIYKKNSTSTTLTTIYSAYNSQFNVTQNCYDYGELTTSDYVYLRTYYYDQNIVLYFAKKGNIYDTGYRYEGKNPNNYVWFNDELWRIIGVFDSTSHGVSGKNLVKIIREEAIDGLVWHKSANNDWVNSSLKSLLNGAYYNATTDTTNCYGYYSTISKTCDYSRKGIQSGYRPMIANVTWYLGGGGATGYQTYIPASMYAYERNNSAIYSGRSASTTGYIGLIYGSDYLYGALSSSCTRFTIGTSGGYSAYQVMDYSRVGCAANDWLFYGEQQLTINSWSNNNSSKWMINFNGYMNKTGQSYSICDSCGFAVHPVLYLNSNVYIYDGDGSVTNPYIIGL